MKTIYIDADFKCHTAPGDGLTAVETDCFDGKCDAFITGCRLKPAGQTWVREDGKIFTGDEMMAPWKDSGILMAYQEQYEAMNAELAASYQEGVNSV